MKRNNIFNYDKINVKLYVTAHTPKAIFRLTRRCAFGYDLLPHPIVDEGTTNNNILFEDVWLAQVS